MIDTNKPTDEPAAAESPSFSVEVLRWTPHIYNGRIGTLSVLLFGELILHDVQVRRAKTGGLWLVLPNTPSRDDRGNVVRDHDQRVIYKPLIAWSRPADHTYFRERVFAFLKTNHAADLAAEAAP